MYNKNQLHPALTGCATNLLSFMCNDSASRLVMVGNHLSQALVLEGATTARVKSGMEREYAENTFNIKMPTTGRILRIIKRYGTKDTASRPPELLILFEDLEEKVKGNSVMGCVSIVGYHTKHQNYGFKYAFQHSIKALAKGEIVPKDTILAKSPNVHSSGDWTYGIEANVAYMSIPQIIEDGFVVSESFCKKMTTTSLGNRMISWGRNRIPLNLYGDKDNYRPFPEIGMQIRPDGLVFATRELDPMLGVVDLSPEKLMTPSTVFDDCCYGPPGAEVYDIRVLQDLTLSQRATPIGMDTQVRRYAMAQSAFYSDVVDAWESFRREHYRHGNVKASDELHRLLAQDCYADNPNSVDRPVPRTYRATPLDEWTVDIRFVRRVVPTVGFKITARHGD